MNLKSGRKDQWTPEPRPEWLVQANKMGDPLDLKNTVPLDENSLISAAKARTGLSDFGDENWHEPFQVYTKALDKESELNLIGRVLTRTDLLIYLEARLKIEETYKQHPEIRDEEISKPLYIVGQGRSGTTLLQSLLASDPNNGTALTWEIMYPCPPPEKETYFTDPRIKQAQDIANLTNRVTPELISMHDFGASEPTECIHLHCLMFQSPWLMAFGGQSPTYAQYLQTLDPVQLYQYERKLMKLLQWKNPRKHWVMKSPICLMHMPQIREVFPDVGFIWPHRDPVKALSSTVSLLGTMQWSRTDNPHSGNSLDALTSADLNAMMLGQPISWLEKGVIPPSALCNIQYSDLIKNPVGTVKQVYEYFDIEWSGEAEQMMQAHFDASTEQPRKTHKYDMGDAEQISADRKTYHTYQQYFQVPDEN